MGDGQKRRTEARTRHSQFFGIEEGVDVTYKRTQTTTNRAIIHFRRIAFRVATTQRASETQARLQDLSTAEHALHSLPT